MKRSTSASSPRFLGCAAVVALVAPVARAAEVHVDATAPAENVTMANHDCAGLEGGAINVQLQSTVEIVNGIVWGNGGDDFATDATSTVTATYTLSEEPLDGVGNLSADPLFVDPAAGDFHVRSTKGRFEPECGDFVSGDVDSPTIDAGDPTSDYALEPGPNGMRINLGHTGNTAQASMGDPGGDPPKGDDSGTSDADDDGEERSDDDAGSDDDEVIGCAFSATGATPGWGAIVLAWVALAISRRGARRGRAT